MRETKFRGKRLEDGQWMFGYYWAYQGHHFIKTNGADSEVDPKTVGQSTGLKGKGSQLHEIEIYEGDIVSGIMPDSNKDEDFIAMIIEWKEDGFCVARQNHLYFGDLMSPVINHCIKVIGNIWDNPELLKAKDSWT